MVRKSIFTLILVLLIPHSVAFAQSKDIFSVSGIAVSIEGEAQTARDRAYQAGQLPAWHKLLEQLVSNVASVPQPSPAELSSWIRDFDIEDEKVAPTRYSGRFTYRFAAEPVKEYLQRNNIAFAEQPPAAAIIIPILYEAGGGTLLWEAQNSWANAWRNFHSANFPAIVPIGSIEDVKGLSVSQAMNGDINALQALAARYGAASAIVTIGTLTGSTQTGFGLEIKTTRYGTAQPENLIASIPSGEKNIDQLMRQGVESVAMNLTQSWKNANLIDSSLLNNILVRIFIPNLAGWTEVQRRLNSVPNIRAYRLESFSRQEAIMTVTYSGTPEQLTNALNNVGLSMANALGGSTILGVNPNWQAPQGTPQPLGTPPSPPPGQ